MDGKGNRYLIMEVFRTTIPRELIMKNFFEEFFRKLKLKLEVGQKTFSGGKKSRVFR